MIERGRLGHRSQLWAGAALAVAAAQASPTATASLATTGPTTVSRLVPTATTAAAPRVTATLPTQVAFDKVKFYATLPLPADAERIQVTEGIDVGFRTRQSEPAMITLYTDWISRQGWTKTTELPYLQPNERWTKDGYEFVVYITPKGAEGVAVINIQVRPQTSQ